MTSAAPRGPRHSRATSHALAALLLAVPGLAWAAEGPSLEPTPTPAPAASRLLPFGAEWARARGIDLPSPFGVGVFLVSMRRDIEVTDVRVTLPGNAPASVSNVATFAVHNNTTMLAAKVDAWLLPVLNVYLLGGYSWTDSRLNATVTIDRPALPPLVLDVTTDDQVGGPLLGGGATLVAGYGPWFIMADANLSVSDIAAFDEPLAALFASARTGWSGTTGWGSWRAWVGLAWLETSRTLKVTTETSIGPVLLENRPATRQPAHRPARREPEHREALGGDARGRRQRRRRPGRRLLGGVPVLVSPAGTVGDRWAS